jgi:hypothetical protein
VHAVANHHDPVQSQSWFGAVPGDELIDSVLLDSARSGRAEAIENCRFTMIQVWEPEHSATVIRLDSVFAHDDGLQCRRIGTTAQTAGPMQGH